MQHRRDFELPERTADKSWSEIKATDDCCRLSVPLYRKMRGQDVWVKRTGAEIKAALAKAAATKQRAYLKSVDLTSSLAH